MNQYDKERLAEAKNKLDNLFKLLEIEIEEKEKLTAQRDKAIELLAHAPICPPSNVQYKKCATSCVPCWLIQIDTEIMGQ